MSRVNFDGIDPAVLVHALYHATRPLGMGVLHNVDSLTVADVRRDLEAYGESNPRFDYYRGRPLKLTLDLTAREFEANLYDRDAGPGAASQVVARLRAQT